MLILISPSKTLDFTTEPTIENGKDPQFIKESKKLASLLRKKSPRELGELMNISTKLSEENALRYSEWHYPFRQEKARPALSTFKGDVYEGLKGWELNPKQLDFADKHLRILSGLYGLLRPTDLILAYRLEMGTKLEGKDFNNLYEFWGNKITRSIKQELKTLGRNVLVNLASEEYAKVVDFKATKARIIAPTFQEFKNGTYKFVSFYGKRARGLMSRYIIDHQLTDPEQMKLFDYEGYEYMDKLSDEEKWVFVR